MGRNLLLECMCLWSRQTRCLLHKRWKAQTPLTIEVHLRVLTRTIVDSGPTEIGHFAREPVGAEFAQRRIQDERQLTHFNKEGGLVGQVGHAVIQRQSG